MNTNTILETIWGFPVPALRELEHSIARIRSLKEEFTVPVEVSTGCPAQLADGSNSVKSAGPATSPADLPTPAPRQPLRPPKPGSLRHTIHDILRRSPGPMQRSNIILAAARLRASTVDQGFKAKVSDILTNALDPNIHRVGYGKYQFRE
jgi:hypothetical protein